MIIFNFNVLALPGETLPTRQPDYDGLKLWGMLHEATIGRLALVVDGEEKQDQVEHWLTVYGIRPAITNILETIDPVIKAEKIDLLASTVGKRDWYIETDPDTAIETIRKGIPTFVVVSPYTVRPEWSSPPTHTPWDRLVDEVKDQQAKRHEKAWRNTQQ